jgi:hypothetical protein
MPKEVLEGLEAARLAGLKKISRLRVHVGDKVFPVLSRWSSGFSVDATEVPPLRGLVDLFDGSNHLAQCLIVASDQEGGEMRYEFKRATTPTDGAPLDYERDPEAPVALIE